MHVKVTMLSMTLVLITASCLPAQSPNLLLTAPEDVGMSAQRLARLTAGATEMVEQGRLAGVVTLVARRGAIVHLEATGWQDKENQIPMQSDTIFRIASMSKPITSVAVMTLYEEKGFNLNSSIALYIPEFQNAQVVNVKLDENGQPVPGQPPTVPAARAITIHDLLTHNSGLSYHWDARVRDYYNEAGITCGLIGDPDRIGQDIRALAKLPLAQQPGAGFNYGLNTDVLGHLVEVLSGMTLAEYFQQRIFGPLGMTDTQFFVNEQQVPRLAKVYAIDDNGQLTLETRDEIVENGLHYCVTYPQEGPRKSYSGGGGLTGTITDYYRFCQMLLNRGHFHEHRLLSRKTVELMTSVHVPMDDGGTNAGFGLGFSVSNPPGQNRMLGSAGVFGWGGFFYTTFFIDPQEELIGISMAQLHPANGVDWQVRFPTLVYQAIDD